MYYYFQRNGALIVVPMASSTLERDDDGDRICDLSGDGHYEVDAGTLEILTSEQVREHLTGPAVGNGDAAALQMESKRASLAIRFCAGLNDETLGLLTGTYPDPMDISKRLNLAIDAL